jgi:hypothetical protein
MQSRIDPARLLLVPRIEQAGATPPKSPASLLGFIAL